MSIREKSLPSIIAGFYAWTIAVFFGGILLDIAYSNVLDEVLSLAERQPVYTAISDGLLWFGPILLLAASGAIAVSWKSMAARAFFIASLIVVLSEFLIPVFLSPFIEIVDSLGIGPWLRIFPGGLGSVLAFVGLYHYYRQSSTGRPLATPWGS